MEFTLLVLFGLAIGSFVSAITYRIPRGIGFVKGRSFCDSCKKNLIWYDNIPLFSFIFNRAKSRCCGKKISIRYPLIEILTVSCFALLYLNFGFGLLYFVYSLLVLLTLIIFIIDFEFQIIPDEFTWLLFICSLFFIPYGVTLAPYSYLFSGFFYSLLFLSLHLITAGKGMGLGDVKLALPIGILLGFEKGIYWFILSFIMGGLVSFFLLLLNKANLKSKISFGPFMVVAFWIVMFFKVY